jgi:hypothetical protein
LSISLIEAQSNAKGKENIQCVAKFSLPVGESWTVVRQTVTIRSLRVTHRTDAAVFSNQTMDTSSIFTKKQAESIKNNEKIQKICQFPRSNFDYFRPSPIAVSNQSLVGCIIKTDEASLIKTHDKK